MSLNSILKQKSKGVIKIAALCASLLAFGFPTLVQAQVPTSQLTYEPELENQRDPNQYCAKCHKLDSDKSQTVDQSGGELHFGKFHGKHLSEKNPSTGKPITCVTCHGNISENHRRGAKDVMRFEGDIFSDKVPMYSVEEQNKVCFSCHQPEKLREKLWAHDVHAMKLPCASCHTLHPKEEAMKEIPHKEQVKLCVDCHGEQQKRQAAKKEPHNLNTEQKDKK